MNLRGLLRRRSPATPCPACGSTDVLWEDEGVYGAGELLWWCASCLHQWHPGDLTPGMVAGPAAAAPPAPVGRPVSTAPPIPVPVPPSEPPTIPPPPLRPPAAAPVAVPQQAPVNGFGPGHAPAPGAPAADGAGAPAFAGGPMVAPGPATVAERVMHAAGLMPLVPCPGAYEPWPCRCSRCGRESSPTYRQVRDEGVGCACGAGRRRKSRFLSRP